MLVVRVGGDCPNEESAGELVVAVAVCLGPGILHRHRVEPRR
ncbi:MAG TPA: hypothetical protein VGK33_18965 [Chloroflexota bacterium]